MEPEPGAERVRGGEVPLDWARLLATARVRARAICKNSPVDPDDLVQEALARLLLDVERIRDRASWVAHVLANLLVSELRRLRVRAESDLSPVGRDAGIETPDSLEASLDLRRHLRRLPDSDQLCLALYATGHTHREIGVRLGQSVHRVGPRIARAKARLRKSLERHA